jgi:hypothetical protein
VDGRSVFFDRRGQENTKYTFGTGDEAASRLEEIAGFFNPPAEDLVAYLTQVKAVWACEAGVS